MRLISVAFLVAAVAVASGGALAQEQTLFKNYDVAREAELAERLEAAGAEVDASRNTYEEVREQKRALKAAHSDALNALLAEQARALGRMAQLTEERRLQLEANKQEFAAVQAELTTVRGGKLRPWVGRSAGAGASVALLTGIYKFASSRPGNKTASAVQPGANVPLIGAEGQEDDSEERQRRRERIAARRLARQQKQQQQQASV